MRVVPGMDQNLTIRQGREAAETMIIDFFKGGTPAQSTAPAPWAAAGKGRTLKGRVYNGN